MPDIGRRRLACRALIALAVAGVAAPTAKAQAPTKGGEGAAAIAVADSLLRALSAGDTATLHRLTADSSIVGVSAMRNGAERVSIRSWASDIARLGTSSFSERGFAPTAQVQDRLALVWMPYDLYRDGKWSHCGVDAFTLLKINGAWKVASLFYTVEQPPACKPHPDGPPRP
ncbi:MAG: hypothetical protein FJ363_07575 [Gemmatimonadetes bacterium]|nr:hypothetical protein [Gemmatimonadota bacterium]